MHRHLTKGKFHANSAAIAKPGRLPADCKWLQLELDTDTHVLDSAHSDCVSQLTHPILSQAWLGTMAWYHFLQMTLINPNANSL